MYTNKQDKHPLSWSNAYVAPKCEITEIYSEGILCNSFETPEDKGNYGWDI